MPLKGHQRTEHQRAQTAAMGKRRWLPKSPIKAKTIDPENSRLLSKERKKSKQELEKIRRLEYNARRREQGAQERARRAEQVFRVQAEEVVDATEERCEQWYEQQREEWRREKESLKKNLARLNARNRREPSRIEHAVQKALKRNKDPDAALPTIRCVKDKQGIVQDWARNAIVTLVNEGVPISKTWSVTKANADAMGVTIVGKWSVRTSGRVVREGGFAAGLMIVEYVLSCITLTLSGDGTTHKNVQFSSRHALVIPPNGDPPKDCFLGITPEVNHTTVTQFEGWKQTIQHLCNNYNSSPLGITAPTNPIRLWEKARGYLSDHASDQKKLSTMLERYRRECDRELRGEAAMLSEGDAEEREQVFVEKGRELMEEIGGSECYLGLSIDEQLQFARRLVHEVQICLGERAYQRLSPEDKEIIDYWVWSGCAMHKDLNAMKGGVDRMSNWWPEFGNGTTPAALMSKFKAVAAKSGSLPEEGPVAAGDRGGAKLTGLLGSLIKHRETKKGHQERFRAFSVEFLNALRPIQFPDTSNNRYQSHGLAATEILHHLDLYLSFLQSIADLKALGNELNHLEQNVEAGLKDPPTLTELSVMSLYSQAISVPFTQRIRTPNDAFLNGLDLGPDYDRVKRHMGAVIDKPDLLLGQGASHAIGTLYGEKWDNEEAIEFIRANQDSLPHLRDVLIAFFQGALETWKEFTKDICDDPKVTGATPEQRRLAFRHPANDNNEGALGTLRQEYRAYPNITFNMVNAKLMCKLNPGVVDYMSKLPPECRRYLRGAAREQDKSKAYQGFLLAQAHEDAKTAKEKRAAVDKRKDRVEKRMAKLNAFKPILNLKMLEEMTVSGDKVDRIKEQLSWHKRIGRDVNIPAGFHAFRKAKAWVAMIQAVQRHLHGVAHQKIKAPEEINENIDAFAGMEIVSDTEGSIDDGNYSNPVGSEDGRPDTGAAMEYALAHDISLDSIVNTEDEDIDLEYEYEDSDPVEYIDTEEEGFEVGPGEEGGKGPTDLRSNHGFDGVELGVVPPPPTRHEPCGRLGAGDQRSHRYTAGCVWTKEDWSCSYDAVFMAFISN